MDADTIHHADNMDVLPQLPAEAFQLVYIDPPFNTGGTQSRRTLTMEPDADGDRTGFKGQRYRTRLLAESRYRDTFEDYLAFLEPRLVELHRVLAPAGSFFLHVDFREVHYCKVLLDAIFGRGSFLNEIIWAYDYGGRTRKRWAPKHDNILWYAKDPKRYTYRAEAIDRIPYMAPKLVGPAKAARGKTPTDTWWHTIVPTSGREPTGYPAQKPLGILQRIVRVHSNPGDRLLDCFAGSGSFGEAAARNGRNCVLVDASLAAVEVMKVRLASWRPIVRDGPAEGRRGYRKAAQGELDCSEELPTS